MTLDSDSDDLTVDSDEEHALDDLCFFEQSQHVLVVEWLWSFTENDKTTCVICLVDLISCLGTGRASLSMETTKLFTAL